MNRVVLTFIVVNILFGACKNTDENQAPNVDHIKISPDIRRFDQALFGLDTTRLDEGIKSLAQSYGDFLPFFLNDIVHDPTKPDEKPDEALKGFVKAWQVRRLYDSCQQIFPDNRLLKQALMPICQYHQYYFPKRPTPHFVAAVTEFTGDAYMVSDSLMLLGLEMFLGPTFSGYNPEFFPYFIRRQFDTLYFPSKVALSLATRIAGPPPGERIIDLMIHNGKILYITDLLTPSVADSIKIGYTREQWEGCEANEQQVWSRLLEMKVLYEPLNSKNQKIVTPSPNAGNVFQEAPGEVGNWLGWRIVRAWMKRNPDATIDKLLAEKDAQRLLEASKYKPKREN
jgi:hypothetical protein